MAEDKIRDQWKLVGDCHQCRRESYCKKECSARKKFVAEQTRILFRQWYEEYMKKKKEEPSDGDHGDHDTDDVRPSAEREEEQG